MNQQEAMRQARLLDTLQRNGFSEEEFVQLRRISNTLSRWAEAECNGDICVDDATGQAYRQYGHGNGPFQTVKCPNREAGAIKRLNAIMAQHPAWTYYHQTDPRGAALYLVNLDGEIGDEVVWEYLQTHKLDCCYSSIGICVY